MFCIKFLNYKNVSIEEHRTRMLMLIDMFMEICIFGRLSRKALPVAEQLLICNACIVCIYESVMYK